MTRRHWLTVTFGTLAAACIAAWPGRSEVQTFGLVTVDNCQAVTGCPAHRVRVWLNGADVTK